MQGNDQALVLNNLGVSRLDYCFEAVIVGFARMALSGNIIRLPGGYRSDPSDTEIEEWINIPVVAKSGD
tara:strand:- start:47 stop:253 length:207 start_codon:yes stop_codon:yes gene_type:complete